MSVVIVDMDERVEKGKEILGELAEGHAHCVVFLSHEKTPLDVLKSLEKENNIVHKILKRPHEQRALLKIIFAYRSQLLSDEPVDMRGGGTESIDVTSFFGGEGPEEAAGETPRAGDGTETEGEPGDETQLINLKKEGAQKEASEGNFLENTDREKQEFVLSSSGEGEEGEKGEAEQEGKASEELASEDVLGGSVPELPTPEQGENDLDDVLGTSMFDLPLEVQEAKEAAFQQEQEQELSSPEAPEQFVEEGTGILTPEGGGGEEIVVGSGEEVISSEEETEREQEEVLGVPEQDSGLSFPDFNELKRESESISEHHEDELLRLKSTLEALREERELLSKKLNERDREEQLVRSKFNSLQAELDEAKIENIFLKKRYEKETENLKYAGKLMREKKDILLARSKKLEEEVNLARTEVSFDTKKIHERESVLESQLELLKVDSEERVKSRDEMIVNLRRKVDTLEFDLQTLSAREKTMREEKYLLEERLERIKDVLQSTIGSIDEELLAEKFEDGDKKLTSL